MQRRRSLRTAFPSPLNDRRRSCFNLAARLSERAASFLAPPVGDACRLSRRIGPDPRAGRQGQIGVYSALPCATVSRRLRP